MRVDDLLHWAEPRTLSIHLSVGVYWDMDNPMNKPMDKWDMVNILTEIEDFSPVSSALTLNIRVMEKILQRGDFSDVTLVCADGNTFIVTR